MPKIDNLRPADRPSPIKEQVQKLYSEIHNFKGESPFRDATISIERYNPETDSLVRATSTYASEHSLENVKYIAIEAEAHGIDIFHLDNVVSFESSTGETITIGPPLVVNIPGEGRLIIDGLHRFKIAQDQNIELDYIFVTDLKSNYLPRGLPINLNEVQVESGVPKPELRHDRRNGVSKRDMLDLGFTGSSGMRGGYLIDSLQTSPASRETIINYRKLFADSIEWRHRKKAFGLDPNIAQTVEGIPGLVPGSLEIYEIVPGISAVKFRQSLGEERPEAKFIMLATTAKEHSIHDGRAGAIFDKDDPVLLDWIKNNPTVDGEKYLPEELRQIINNELRESNFPEIPPQLDFGDLTGKIPKVNRFSVFNENSKYYALVSLLCDDNLTISFAENHNSEIVPGQIPTQGSLYCMIRPDGKILVVVRHREILGPRQSIDEIETPRTYERNLKRVGFEAGIEDVGALNFSVYNCCQEPSKNNIELECNVVDLPISVDIQKQAGDIIFDDTLEISRPMLIDGDQVDNLVRQDKMTCDMTLASVTIGQLSKGFLSLAPGHENEVLLLRETYSVAHGKYLLIMPEIPVRAGTYVGSGYQDSGKWLRSLHLFKPNYRPKNQRLKAISVSEISQMILDGKFDTSTIAQIRRLFTKGKIWQYNPTPPIP